MELAGSRLAKARVEGDHFDDLDGLDAELSRYPVDGGSRNVAKALLHHVQQGEHGGTLLVVGIMGNGFGGFAVEGVVSGEGLEEFRARGFR